MATTFPKQGVPRSELFKKLKDLKANDAHWREGRTFSLVYFAGDDVSQVAKDAYSELIATNALSPFAFPSLQQMESEVVGACGDLFHGGESCRGTLTSGGTESILMAMKTARDWGRSERKIDRPEVVAPITVHPAFEKAAHYLDLTIRHAPVDAGFRADVAEMEKLITPNTVMLIGSAMPYPHGVVDPIEQIAALAKSKGLLCHVDACLGGFILPFARKLGRDIPKFDFEVDGVSSLSADLHKYGYAAKGASVVLYRDAELRKHQFFTYASWPGGLYVSPSMMGTRPGGAIASAWAVMNYLGEEGYLAKAKVLLDTTDRLIAGVKKIDGLKMHGAPHASVFSFGSDVIDIYALGDAMEARGWKLDRQHNPPALHLMVTPAHEHVVAPLLADLSECVSAMKKGGAADEGAAAFYGLATRMEAGEAAGYLRDFLDGLYQP
ncbi:MAG: aspartate aminotransferase family protein [Myxococcaceae bacterium]